MTDMLLIFTAFMFLASLMGSSLQRQYDALKKLEDERGHRCKCSRCGDDGLPVKTYPLGHLLKVAPGLRMDKVGPHDKADVWMVVPLDYVSVPPVADSAQ